MKRGLTSLQIQQFQDEGFLKVRQLLETQAFAPLIQEFEQTVCDLTKEAVRQKILQPSDTFDDSPFAKRLALVSESCSDRNWLWRRIQGPRAEGKKHKTAGMFLLRTWPALLDAIESLIGSEILAHPQFACRVKLPDQEETVVAWHQDVVYLDHELMGQTTMVNAWIPLVQATTANGCMEVLRGSHRIGLLPHNDHQPMYHGIADADLPPCEAVTCEADVGDVVFTAQLLVHHSLPNRSDTVRWSVDSRYSRIGLPTGRAKVPGFVARSCETPQSIARSHHEWIRLLTEAGVDPLEQTTYTILD